MKTEIGPDGIARPIERSPWRKLGIFWVVVFLVVAGGVEVLQILGPPGREVPEPPPKPEIGPMTEPVELPKLPTAEGRGIGDVIPDPEPAMLIAAPHAQGAILPKIRQDGRKPMQAYAAGFDRADRNPRVAVMLAGIGLSAPDDDEAKKLAPMVSFAISPYAVNTSQAARAARIAAHEVFVGVPMEPQGYPLNDPGPMALLTGAPPAVNALKLEQALGLAGGYVGITNTIGSMRGERYSASQGINDVLQEAVRRGLLFLDARPGAKLASLPGLVSRSVDLLLDVPPVGHEIDVQLGKLVDLAKARGSAIGLAGAPHPVTVVRLAEWVNSLPGKGVVLVPVSALLLQTGTKPP